MSKREFEAIAGEGVVGPIVRLFDALKFSEEPRKRGVEDATALRTLDVIGVRDAKGDLSRIFNEVSAGRFACVKAGDGGVVFLVNARILAGAVAVLEEKREMTLGEALIELPFRPEQLPQIELRGRASGETALRRRPSAALFKTR